MKDKRYIYLEHTADAKFQAFGSSLEKAFENAALAMLSIMAKTSRIKPKKEDKIRIKGKDLKALLYNWLEEILFILDSKNLFISKIKELKISGKEGSYKLEATVLGDSAKNYEITGEVKAVTYHEMLIKQEGKKFIVQVVVDL